ncbi:MAG: hypothetical protein JJT93_08435 [Gammaproteobacteria bacterium]|nr:hypothetical protein [Gammaproteobacteria bacterium]TVQ45953.1 MAG: hypothetical protein EA371_11225 [Gammaproteobacteria bacterium]
MSNDPTRRIAEEAARIILDDAVQDYGLAKRKARERLGLPLTLALPKNTEVEQALVALQTLFGGTEHTARLDSMRRTALEAMRALAAFSPRLVGPVLAGTATEHSAVNLHVFADTPEEVLMALFELRIPFDSFERRLRTRAGAGYEEFPALRFIAGDTPIEVTVFPCHGVRQAPLSPVDGKPMRRAAEAEILSLLTD